MNGAAVNICLDLVPKWGLCIDSLSEQKVTAVVPVQHSQMDTIHGVYPFDSLADAGKYIDDVGLGPRFQELVDKANELGTLVLSGMNINVI